MVAETLAGLRQGQRARIETIDTSDPQVLRLMTLGLVEGVEVELASMSLGGDPLELRVFGRAISLRAAQARCFTISEVVAGG